MGQYRIDETFEHLEINAFEQCDKALQEDKITVDYYFSQHRTAFWRHILLCSKVDYKQRDAILRIFENWQQQVDVNPILSKDEMIKITRPARQHFLSLIAAQA